ncbi:Vitamin K-dependent protein C (Fragment) [Seminavis robusta]|uniref:Vitamin K-dependent protein C n=1 Tax=Seminavis robusta TaxID=568900 RepID=A0A9N8ETV2_9STRA
MSASSKQQWSRLARVVFQLCLVWQPTRGSASGPRRRRLRQRIQHEPSQTLPSSSVASASSSSQHQHQQQHEDRNLLIQTRIVNGRDVHVPHQDFPFFVQWYRGCGATLIHADVALTAAHCFTDTLRDHRVRVEGDPKHSFIEILDYLIHPEFNDETNLVNNNANDFMLLKLAKPVPSVRPIQLQSDNDLPLRDQEDLTIVGYGLTAEDGDISNILQEATVQYHHDCSFARYRPGKVGRDSMFCAHGKFNDTLAVDSCQGDSGGPILRKTPQGWLQVGVTSWGEGCARPDAPGIYARTQVAHEWVNRELCHLSEVPPPHCSFPNNMTLTGSAIEIQQNVDAGLLVVAAENNNATNTSVVPNVTISTTLTLRVDIHYDNYPQEISWALAQQQQQQQQSEESATTKKNAPLLKLVSPRPTVSLRNQRISQHILDVQPGTYRLEVYDTIAGDGISLSNEREEEDAIQVWLLTTTTTTRTLTNASNSSQVAKVGWNEGADAVDAESVSQLLDDHQDGVSVTVTHHVDDARLLWKHSGDFGEFVYAEVPVA